MTSSTAHRSGPARPPLSPKRYRQDALAGFLRDRRSRIDPDPRSPAFDPHSPRRVPGQRREELAWAAGISVDYYVKLEQGRMLSPSSQVIANLATSLRLSDLDRRYLELLCVREPTGCADPSARGRASGADSLGIVADHFPDATMLHLLDKDLHLTLPDPRSRQIMFPGADDPIRSLSLLDYMFADEYEKVSRQVYVDWSDKATEVIGLVHMKMASGAASAALFSTVDALLERPSFRSLWRLYRPFENTTGQWRMRLPGTGPDTGENPGPEIRTCRFITITDPQDPDLSLVIYL